MKKIILMLCFICVSMLVFGQEATSFIQNGKYGIKNKQGKVIVKPKYEKVLIYQASVGLIPAKLNGRWGFFDATGKLIIPHLYKVAWSNANYGQETAFNSNGNAEVEADGREFCIDKTGKVVPGFINEFIPNGQYAACYSLRPTRPQAEFGTGKMGVVSRSGDIVVPMEYEFVNLTDDNYPISVLKEKGGEYGFIDLNNNLFVPFKYESVSGFYKPDETFKEKVARVKLDGVYYYMDKTGKHIGEVNEETLRKFKEEAEKRSAQMELAIEELKQANEKRHQESNSNQNSNSSSSSSKTTKVYHCGYCGTTVVGEKQPSSNNCPSPSSNNTAAVHKWKVLGTSGDTAYTCSHCKVTVKTEGEPESFDNCSGKRTSLGHPSGHNWKKK